MATVAEATIQAATALHDLVDLGIDPATTSAQKMVLAVADWLEDHPRPSDGERALVDLVFALWNGSRNFGVNEMARLDRTRKRQALAALTTWVEATS